MIGMLWFDNDPKTLFDAKVTGAAIYFAKKYGVAATTCVVHPTMYPVQLDQDYWVGEIQIKHNRSTMPNHFWVCSEHLTLHPVIQLIPSKPARSSQSVESEINQLSFLEA